MKILNILLILFVASLFAAGTAFAQESPRKIVLGCETSLLPSAVWIAENKGYFGEEGLEVEIRDFGSGKTAFQNMLSGGDLDMVTVAQTPVVFNSFVRNDFLIIGAMVHSYEDVKLLARKDRGIKQHLDLKGKKVGITRGSTGHYFLGAFLVYHDLKMTDVQPVDLEASELPRALADSRVDAISTWEPHISTAAKLLGEKAHVLALPPVFREDFYFVARKGFVEQHPEALKQFLMAVSKGEVFIRENRTESIRIVSKRLQIPPDLTASLWDGFHFRLFLDQSILMTLEHEARWAMKEGLVANSRIPNYLDFIHMDALEEVDPKSVTIIR